MWKSCCFCSSLELEDNKQKKKINREFNLQGDVYVILSLSPRCAELKKKGEDSDIIKIWNSNPYFKVLVRELAGRGILATDI